MYRELFGLHREAEYGLLPYALTENCVVRLYASSTTGSRQANRLLLSLLRSNLRLSPSWLVSASAWELSVPVLWAPESLAWELSVPELSAQALSVPVLWVPVSVSGLASVPELGLLVH